MLEPSSRPMAEKAGLASSRTVRKCSRNWLFRLDTGFFHFSKFFLCDGCGGSFKIKLCSAEIAKPRPFADMFVSEWSCFEFLYRIIDGVMVASPAPLDAWCKSYEFLSLCLVLRAKAYGVVAAYLADLIFNADFLVPSIFSIFEFSVKDDLRDCLRLWLWALCVSLIDFNLTCCFKDSSLRFLGNSDFCFSILL